MKANNVKTLSCLIIPQISFNWDPNKGQVQYLNGYYRFICRMVSDYRLHDLNNRLLYKTFTITGLVTGQWTLHD